MRSKNQMSTRFGVQKIKKFKCLNIYKWICSNICVQFSYPAGSGNLLKSAVKILFMYHAWVCGKCCTCSAWPTLINI